MPQARRAPDCKMQTDSSLRQFFLLYHKECNMGLNAVPALNGAENQVDLTSEREALHTLEHRRMSPLVG